jgi:hypothetical protein
MYRFQNLNVPGTYLTNREVRSSMQPITATLQGFNSYGTRETTLVSFGDVLEIELIQEQDSIYSGKLSQFSVRGNSF